MARFTFGRSSKDSAQSTKPGGAEILGKELASVIHDDGKPFWTKWHLLRLNLLLLVPLFTSATVGYDGAMMNATQIAPLWKVSMGNPNAGELGLSNAIFPVGKVVGLLIITPVADRLGRKRPIAIGACLCIAGAAIQAASVNFGMFVFSRFFLGFGTVWMAQPSPLLITELAHPLHRGKLTALFNTFYYFGAILAAWLTFGTVRMTTEWSWRIPSLFQSLFPLLQLLGIWWLPESPRWLISKGRQAEARAILTHHHAGDDEDSPLVAFEMQEIDNTIRLEREATSDVKVKQLFSTRANRWRVLIAVSCGVISQWNGVGVVSYYISLVLKSIGITDPTHQALINGLLQVFNFIISVTCGALMVDKLGRRFLFLWSAAGMMLSYVAWTVLTSEFISSKSKPLGIAVVPMIFVFYFHYDIAWTPLVLAYPTECFPFALRSLGVSITYFSIYVALIFNLFVNPIAMASIGWKYYIVFCVFNALLIVFIWFCYPETKGHTLEEIAVVFEGKDAAVQQIMPNVLADTKRVEAEQVEGKSSV